MKPVSQYIFQEFFKTAQVSKYWAYLAASKKYPIKEHLHFLAQIAHESNYLKYKKESHFYSLKRIRQIFGKYFKGMSDSDIKIKYEKKAALLDRVYANRIGNGDEKSRDGSKFRGRGYIQLTGRGNYKKYGFDKNPKAILDEGASWAVCFAFWRVNKIDSLCDNNFSDLSEKEIKKITKRINGGFNGLSDRLEKSDRIEKYFKLKGML